MKIGDSFYTFTNLTPNEEKFTLNFSFFPFHNNSNKLKFLLKEILGIKENEESKYNNNSISNEKIKKVLAFKENIFVHNKNLSLNSNNKISEQNTINNQKKKKYFLGTKNKNEKDIQNKSIRPKSAIIQFQTNIKSSSMKSKLILDKNIFDISCRKNSNDKNNNFSFSNMRKKNKKNENPLNYKKSRSKSLNVSHNLYEDVDEIKSVLKNKIMNLKFIKNKRPQMFIKRPIPTLNQKYLLFLPKEIIKDTRNKYNFFSYIKTDDIYNNNINIFHNKNKHKNKVQTSKNKIKNKSNNKKNNLFNNFMLKSEIEKNPKTLKYTIRRNTKNTIYKPVKLKIDEIFNKYKIKQQTENTKGCNLNEEEGDFFKIKSHPFKNKK